MKHSVTVSVDENGKRTKIVKAREQSIREKMLTALFGKKAKVLVITPYEATNEITIKEQGLFNDRHERSVHFDCT